VPTAVAFAVSLAMVGVGIADLGRTRRAVPKPIGAVPAVASTQSTTGPNTTGSESRVNSDTWLPIEADRAVTAPTAIAIPSLRVQATVTPVSAGPDGSLGVPPDPHVLGWWSGGAAPGDRYGTVVIDGHVDTAAEGPGALFHLADIAVGSRVVVQTVAGEIDYTVAARRSFPKTELPPTTFTTTWPPTLVIVTCGGPFDAASRHYEDNVVAYAVPADTHTGTRLLAIEQ
jgi:hypothetical protein